MSTTLQIFHVTAVEHVVTQFGDFLTHDLLVMTVDGTILTVKLFAESRLNIPAPTVVLAARAAPKIEEGEQT